MFPLLIPAVSAFAGRMVGKSGAEAEADERIEHIKVLADLTPAQAAAVDAVKKQPIEEVRTRVALGIGPTGPLPANASQRAQEIRAQHAQEKAQNVTLTAQEHAQIAAAPDPQAALNAIADQKAAQIVASVAPVR